jgi:hypothetical protein
MEIQSKLLVCLENIYRVVQVTVVSVEDLF